MKRMARWGLSLLTAGGGLAGVILLVAWLSGWFEAKVPAGATPATWAWQARAGAARAAVEAVQSPRIIPALGTIRAVQETAVASKLLARVRQVRVAAGQPVDKGQVLVELDQADIQAQVSQSRAAIVAAEARLSQADSDLAKVTDLLARQAATPREAEDHRRRRDIATAELQAAKQRLAEVETLIEHATVTAPLSGVVVEKQIEEGDLARPGQTLLTLYDPSRLQLVAPVPERLALGLAVGQTIAVHIDAIDMTCHGQVSEIVPQASAATRSFLVKVTGPCPPGVYSGMFARLLLEGPAQTRLLVPASAVRRVGQVETVLVEAAAPGTGLVPRLVRTGAESGDGRIEVLAGLTPGETVLTRHEDAQPAQALP